MLVLRRLTFAILLLVTLCAWGQDVHYNYDRGANFPSYKTYQWIPVQGGVPDPLIDQAIKSAVDEQLKQKGLEKVEANGELRVRYQVVLREEKGVNLMRNGFGPGFWGDSTITGQTSSIPVGTLVVDLYDGARNQLIWRGDATKTIDLNKNPDKNYKTLQKAVAKLLKNYPPPAKK